VADVDVGRTVLGGCKRPRRLALPRRVGCLSPAPRTVFVALTRAHTTSIPGALLRKVPAFEAAGERHPTHLATASAFADSARLRPETSGLRHVRGLGQRRQRQVNYAAFADSARLRPETSGLRYVRALGQRRQRQVNYAAFADSARLRPETSGLRCVRALGLTEARDEWIRHGRFFCERSDADSGVHQA
jgi:hypothetical protein